MRITTDQVADTLKKGLVPAWLIAGDEALLTGEAADAVRAGARSQGFSGRESFVTDRYFDWSELLASTRALSLVVIARGDLDPAEIELLECGANAILRLPAGPEWNDRLERLMDVPVRKEARFPVSFDVEASANGGGAANAQALNLSASGMLIETEVALKVQDEVQLQIGLPVSIDPLRIPARVVRVAAPSQFGVEFRGLGPVESRRIQGYLATLGA